MTPAPGSRRAVDINADVGEGGDDEMVINLVTSVSIACGGHAGDADTMAAALEAARRLDVLTGAHPGYPDREGFGRRDIEIAPAELTLALMEQLETLGLVALQHGRRITHVKTHGALYNRAWRDAETARLVARAVAGFSPEVALFCPPGSEQENAAESRGLAVIREAFADRRYAPDGTLLPRTEPGAVISDPADLPEQLSNIASSEFDTLCVHSDNPAAVALLEALPGVLAAMGWEVGPYPLP